MSMLVAHRRMDLHQQQGFSAGLTFSLPGDRAHRLAQVRLFAAALAHGMCLVMLMMGASLGQLPFPLVGWAALAFMLADGASWMLIGKARRLPRHDPTLNVPLAMVSLAGLAGLMGCLGMQGVETLAATAPFLILASCQLKRPKTSWAGALVLAAVGVALMGLRHSGYDTHAMGSAWLVVSALCGIAMHVGVAGLAKRLRWPVIDTWIRSSDRRQRMFILRYLVGAFNCAAGITVLNIGLYYGICKEPVVIRYLTWLAVIVMCSFYAVLRSGLNRKLSDPSMTEYQILAAISFLAVGYWLAGTRGEGVAIIILVVILLFGMFSTTPTKVGRCCIYSLVSFACPMLVVGMTDPDPTTLIQQWVHFGVMVVVMPTIYILADQLAQLRARLTERKEALKAALGRIEALATRDELTGLPNRRNMIDQLTLQQQRAKRSGKPFGICMVDIDHFKRINDIHGHGVGDEVLKAFTSAASASLRDTDVIARWGGEEFLLLLPDIQTELASQAIDRMHHAIGRAATLTEDLELAVTFSAGLVCCQPNEPVDQAIERADQALYRAKSEGRNRTVLG